MPNRLASETSPYLRQHADNPVDWFPWGAEAFEKARAENKPIFLSIGYSTCHWCHVMARESFENVEIASILNAGFVPIKVDREERPDVDRVYMAYVQALAGHGGWPLSAWLTPELKPFFGGTYFPPEDRMGRAGFASILRAIAKGWRDDRGKLAAQGERALSALGERPRPKADRPPAAELAKRLFEEAGPAFEGCFHALYQAFDAERGGIGGAPKFPQPSNLEFLFRCAAIQGPGTEVGREAVGMAASTLQGMARGGIHDHVGGGFHRYSVDEDWFVPHFEKMLYDQAQIALNALEAWSATGDARHAWLVRDILDYCLRDIAHPGGGFYAAEDADSMVPGAGPGTHVEGAFYVWTRAELREALGPDAEIVCAHFGVKEEGNVPAARDPHGEFKGRNILAQAGPLSTAAKEHGLSVETASDRIAASLERLRAVRARRPRPHLDDKIITAWNGLMISALARAAASPAEPLAALRDAYRGAAVRAARFIEGELYRADSGALHRAWCGTRGSAEGFAEDYACLIQGLIDLYETTFDAGWLQWAEGLQTAMDKRFWDEENGGYFNSAEGAPDIVLRLKEDHDGAEPSANSVAAMNLLRLGAVFDDGPAGYRSRALRTLAAFESRLREHPQTLPRMLCAFELALEPPRHLVLVGDPAGADFQALAAVNFEGLGPRRAILAVDGGAGQAWLLSRAPWLAGMRRREGRAAAYLCENFTCQAPVADPEELRLLLRGRPAAKTL